MTKQLKIRKLLSNGKSDHWNMKLLLYICALTHPVREGDWDQPTIRIAKLEKTGYI